MTISAVTLATHDMARAIRFYRALGFTVHHEGEAAAFSSRAARSGSPNLISQSAGRAGSWWSRVSSTSLTWMPSMFQRSARRDQ